jgi:DNA-binding GntR family transcriptional regulator
MNPLYPGDHRATLTQRLAGQVRQSILGGAYAPGAPLREAELSARYDVSRHVIREILRTLAADGLVDYASFRGARVPVITEADARDIYRSRRAIECGPEAMTTMPDGESISAIHGAFAAAVKAADWPRAFELDTDFHAALLAAADSPRASAWLAGLLRDLRLAHLVAPSFNHRVMQDSVAQHGEVVAAIEAGDATAARAALRRHLDAAEAALVGDMGRA